MLEYVSDISKIHLSEFADLYSISALKATSFNLTAFFLLFYYIRANSIQVPVLGRIATAFLTAFLIVYAALHHSPYFVLLLFAATALPRMSKRRELPKDSEIAWTVHRATGVICLGILLVLNTRATLRVILLGIFGFILAWWGLLLWDFWRRLYWMRFNYADEAKFTPSPKNFTLVTLLPYLIAFDQHIDRVDLSLDEHRRYEDCMIPLQNTWGITNRQALLETLENLRTSLQREHYAKIVQVIPTLSSKAYKALIAKTPEPERLFQYEMVRKNTFNIQLNSFLAWDLVRIPYLAKLGVNLGYITEKEFFDYCLPIARAMQMNFRSWQHLLDDFLAGRIFWSGSSSKYSVGLAKRIRNALLNDKHSPINKIPWNTPLGVEMPHAIIMGDDAFWSIIDEVRAKASFSTFPKYLQTTLQSLDEDTLFAFQNRLTIFSKQLDDPKINFVVAHVLFSSEEFIDPFKTWILFQGQNYTKRLFNQCDNTLAAVVEQFYDLKDDSWHIKNRFVQRMFDAKDVFNIGRQVAEIKQLNPMFRYLTLEEIRDLVVVEPYTGEMVYKDFPALFEKLRVSAQSEQVSSYINQCHSDLMFL
jgi:hypothetical protein